MADTNNTELILLLGRLDGKMDTVIQANADHGKRISALEKARWQAMGGSAVLASLVSFAVTLAAAWPFK